MKMESPNHAAVFIDYENILYHLKAEYAQPPQLTDVITGILRNLRSYLSNELKLDVIITKAYADFERQASALGSLYLMGIDTHNVLGTEHKNAADMRLCIDLMEVLYTRQDVQHFVLVAGDRDYIPIVQQLRRQGRSVKAVAFRANLSGDLLQILGEQNLIEADQFIVNADKKELLIHKNSQVGSIGLKIVDKIDLSEIEAKTKKKPASLSAEQPATASTASAKEPPKKSTALQYASAYETAEVQNMFETTRNITHANTKQCLEILVQFAVDRNLREVWLAPFLRHITDVMPMLADYERKELITNMRIYGAIAIEKRPGEVNDFSVILINYNHPNVKACIP